MKIPYLCMMSFRNRVLLYCIIVIFQGQIQGVSFAKLVENRIDMQRISVGINMHAEMKESSPVRAVPIDLIGKTL